MAPTTAKPETIDVTVERVCWPREARPAAGTGDTDAAPRSGRTWYILATDRGTAKGEMAWRPAVGERLTLGGKWGVRNGQREFAFATAVPNVPVDPRDALHYACERTLGIGPALEQAIWDAKGGNWRDIAAGDIKRLDGDLYLRFRETVDALTREGEKSAAISWLLGRGATLAMAAAAWDKWGIQTTGVVNADPYRLAELSGYGFGHIDRSIRIACGIGDADPRRIRGAVVHAMRQAADAGDTAVEWEQLRNLANESLGGIWSAAVCDQVRAMFATGVLRPFHASRRIALGTDAEAAEAIWQFAAAVAPHPVASTAEPAADATGPSTPFDAPPPAADTPAAPAMVLDPSQREAVAFAARARLAIVTGGAGTGKTTIIREIARAAGDGKAVLCAFAGKAAARLREATGFDASTIHRLLGFDGTRYRTRSLAGLRIIVDEASMIDESLLAEIVSRNPEGIVLVGDEAQLPPVGRGQPFHDLIRLRPDLARRLERCYRQTEAVFKAANMIRRGAMPPPHLHSPMEQWDILSTGDPAATESAILRMVQAGEIDFQTDLILTPRNGEGEGPAPSTVTSLNRAIREIVNPNHGERKVDVGDRVICTKNFADADVWNGTTGTVHAIDDAGQVWVALDLPAIGADGLPTDKVLFDRDMRPHLSLAYALTVHKAQGSQYRRVVVVALARDGWGLLDRALAYTAVTRARAVCTVVGQPRALQDALARIGARVTALQEVAAAAAPAATQEARSA